MLSIKLFDRFHVLSGQNSLQQIMGYTDRRHEPYLFHEDV